MTEVGPAIPASGLADTGSNIVALSLTGFGLLMLGLMAGAAVWLQRRRRTE